MFLFYVYENFVFYFAKSNLLQLKGQYALGTEHVAIEGDLVKRIFLPER